MTLPSVACPAPSVKPATYIPTPIPSTIKEGVEHLSTKSGQLAGQILREAAHEELQATGPVVIHHYYTPWYYHFWSPYYFPSQPVVVVDRGRDSKEEAMRILVGVAFAIIAGIAAGSAGAAYSRYKDASNELKETEELKVNLDVYSDMSDKPDAPYIKETKSLIDLKNKVCTRIKNSALADLILRAGVLASAILAVVGAVALLPGYFMSIGVVGTIGFGVAMLFKLAMESKQADIDDARAMRANIARLNAAGV